MGIRINTAGNVQCRVSPASRKFADDGADVIVLIIEEFDPGVRPRPQLRIPITESPTFLTIRCLDKPEACNTKERRPRRPK